MGVTDVEGALGDLRGNSAEQKSATLFHIWWLLVDNQNMQGEQLFYAFIHHTSLKDATNTQQQEGTGVGQTPNDGVQGGKGASG